MQESIVKGSYDKFPTVCDPNDLHFFYRMLIKDESQKDIRVMKASVSDVFILNSHKIQKWKFIKGEDGQLYLGYITCEHNPFRRSSSFYTYVVAPSKDPKNFYIALYQGNIRKIWRP